MLLEQAKQVRGTARLSHAPRILSAKFTWDEFP